MIPRLLAAVVLIVVASSASFWFLTMPRTFAAADLPAHTPDVANGERLFWAGGCESCHAAADATGDDLLKLGGGGALVSDFGTFYAPNISPDAEHGIGAWSTLDFVNAMKFGVAPGGTHLYPAFPYTSYQRMRVEDIIDVKAFLDTLPAVATASRPHEIGFPFNIRRGIGLWQRRYVDGRTFEPDPAMSEAASHGGYLVQGAGHCGECHTPRGFDGGPITSRALAGGPAPEGSGTIPNITPDASGIGSWSEDDIVAFLTTGFTPDFDSAGGSMTAVVRNMAKLPADDVAAIAAYLKAIPPLPSS